MGAAVTDVEVTGMEVAGAEVVRRLQVRRLQVRRLQVRRLQVQVPWHQALISTLLRGWYHHIGIFHKRCFSEVRSPEIGLMQLQRAHNLKEIQTTRKTVV